MPDEEKYRDVKKLLKSLPKVKAREDFETRLFRRLRDIEAGKYSTHKLRNLPVRTIRFGWLTNILKPAYASAIGVTVILLICVVFYISYLPHKEQNVAPVTQAPAIENQKQEQPITQSDLGISKQETPSFEKRQLNRQETSQFIPGIEKPSSDYEITLPPTVSPSESPAPTLRSIEAEPKSEDKDVKTEQSIDDMKKSERKEAPEMKKEKDVEKSNKGDEVLQKTITPSINEERILGKDSIKLDTVKVMGKMKKEGKKVKESKDSLKNQPLKKPPVNDEKQPDTSK